MSAAEPDYEALRDKVRETEANGGLVKPTLPSPELEQARREMLKFNLERRNNILTALQSGLPASTAAALAGIDTSTLYAWMRAGANDSIKGIESEYAKFSDDCNKAVAVAEGRALKVVTDKMGGGPDAFRSATWFLERRFPDRWGKKEKIEVGGDASQPIVVQLTWPGGGGVTDDQESLPEEHEHVEADAQIYDAEIVDPAEPGSLTEGTVIVDSGVKDA